MNTLLKSAVAIGTAMLTAQSWAQITFYEDNDFRGQVFSVNSAVENFRTLGFNDRASSVVVEGGRWEVCDNASYGGRCVVLRRGSYASLGDMGMNDRVSSARPANDQRATQLPSPEPLAAAPYEYRRRPDERIYQAPVVWSRAVVGPPEERCWMEHIPASEPARTEPSVGRGVLGAIIGGVIGHQIGSGTGRDVATVGGAVAGAAIGANSGRDRGGVVPSRDVRRCDTQVSRTPTYWDVAYTFNGVEHQMQMSMAPGSTVNVNDRGEPRL